MDKSFLNNEYKNDLYSPILLRNSFQIPDEFILACDEYFTITGKIYENLDQTMIFILKSYKNLIGFYFRIVYIKNNFILFSKIINYGSYEDIIIDYNKYKIDLIKRILSSEQENNILIESIESIIFQEINNCIKNEDEYSFLIQK